MAAEAADERGGMMTFDGEETIELDPCSGTGGERQAVRLRRVRSHGSRRSLLRRRSKGAGAGALGRPPYKFFAMVALKAVFTPDEKSCSQWPTMSWMLKELALLDGVSTGVAE